MFLRVESRSSCYDSVYMLKSLFHDKSSTPTKYSGVRIQRPLTPFSIYL